MSKGFAPIILILVFVVVAAGIVGGAFYLKSQKNASYNSTSTVQVAPSASNSASANPTPIVSTANNFVIKELGIQFPLGSVQDFEYVIDKDGSAMFSTKTLDSLGKQLGADCSANNATVGWVIRRPASEDLGEAPVDFIVQVDNHKFYMSYHQNPCSDDKRVLDALQSAVTDLKTQLKLAKPI